MWETSLFVFKINFYYNYRVSGYILYTEKFVSSNNNTKNNNAKNLSHHCIIVRLFWTFVSPTLKGEAVYFNF